MVHRQ